MKKPNAWGLYDMHGNVKEWCSDRYQKAPLTRWCCGGCWGNDARGCRSAGRDYDGPDDRRRFVGFRLAKPSG